MQEATEKYISDNFGITASDLTNHSSVNVTFGDDDKKQNKTKKQHNDLKTLQTRIKLYRFQVSQ